MRDEGWASSLWPEVFTPRPEGVQFAAECVQFCPQCVQFSARCVHFGGRGVQSSAVRVPPHVPIRLAHDGPRGTRGLRGCVNSVGPMCPVLGLMCPVFAPMCQLFGRMCPVSGAMCPLWRGRCPVLGGGRWLGIGHGRKARFLLGQAQERPRQAQGRLSARVRCGRKGSRDGKCWVRMGSGGAVRSEKSGSAWRG